MGPFARVDDNRWPLVVVRFLRSPHSDEEIREYLSSLAFFRRGEPYAVIVDTRGARAASASQRRTQAEWIQANADGLRRFNVGTAFVIDSALLRGMLTAVLWLQPLPQPHHVVSTMAAAEGWCQAKLRRAKAI